MENLDQPNNLQLYVEKTWSGIAPIKGENPHLFSLPWLTYNLSSHQSEHPKKDENNLSNKS